MVCNLRTVYRISWCGVPKYIFLPLYSLKHVKTRKNKETVARRRNGKMRENVTLKRTPLRETVNEGKIIPIFFASSTVVNIAVSLSHSPEGHATESTNQTKTSHHYQQARSQDLDGFEAVAAG